MPGTQTLGSPTNSPHDSLVHQKSPSISSDPSLLDYTSIIFASVELTFLADVDPLLHRRR